MTDLQPLSIDNAGAPLRVLRNRADPHPTVFLHGGVPGAGACGAGSHLWGGVLDCFMAERAVLVWEAYPDCDTLDALTHHIQAGLQAMGLSRCHLVAHDVSGLSALLLACTAPQLVRAVTVVSSVAATPTGDGVENLTLAYPPLPPDSRRSQRWVLERIAFSHHHVDDALLDACVRTVQSPAWRSAADRRAQPAAQRQWSTSVSAAKARLFEICRGDGLPVPVQVVWGTHDPLGTLDQGLWLYRLLAQRQSSAHFHAVHRTGALPFREEPGVFHQVVAAFDDGIAGTC